MITAGRNLNCNLFPHLSLILHGTLSRDYLSKPRSFSGLIRVVFLPDQCFRRANSMVTKREQVVLRLTHRRC
jgi:hypothetical protein